MLADPICLLVFSIVTSKVSQFIWWCFGILIIQGLLFLYYIYQGLSFMIKISTFLIRFILFQLIRYKLFPVMILMFMLNRVKLDFPYYSLATKQKKKKNLMPMLLGRSQMLTNFLQSKNNYDNYIFDFNNEFATKHKFLLESTELKIPNLHPVLMIWIFSLFYGILRSIWSTASNWINDNVVQKQEHKVKNLI